MDSTTPRVNYFPLRNVQKKFQLKIPTLSRNYYSATWCPNCCNKKTTPGKLRNGHRYEKHVVFIRPTLLTVADLFKPTMLYVPHFEARKFLWVGDSNFVCTRFWSNCKSYTIWTKWTVENFFQIPRLGQIKN